ncbi:MAG: cell cycle histidine kinase CckA [Hyphomicrobiales bacterium]
MISPHTNNQSEEHTQPESAQGVNKRIVRLAAVVFVLIACVIGVLYVPQTYVNQLVMGFLGMFATVGILSLFLWALGFFGSNSADSEETLSRLYVDTLSEGICITDHAGRIVHANPAYKTLTGVDQAAALRSVETIFSRDPDAADAIFRLGQIIQSERFGEEEVRLPVSLSAANSMNNDLDTPRPSDGYWYSVQVRPLPLDASTEPLQVWRVADITNNRESQENIFQELQTAIDYLDHAPVGFLSVNPDGRLAYLNATLAEWLGLDIAEVRPSDLHLFDLVDTQAAGHLLAANGTLIKPSSENIDLDFMNASGQSVPVRLVHQVPVSADGQTGASRSVVINRAESGDASDALRAAEVRFSRFFNNTPIAIASVTRDRRLGRCNARFVRLFGPEFVEGRQVDLVNSVIDNDRPNLRAALTAAINGRSGIEPVEATLEGEGDRSAKIYVSGVEANDDNEAAIIFAQETTEQRTLEEQFAQSQKMQAIGQLAGGVAHDFNNVLTAIIGFSDLLLNSHKPSDPSFQDIMNIKQNANRAAGLVRQLLAFSRRQTLRPQVLQLSDVMNEVSVMLDRLLGEKVNLEVRHGRDLWPVKADLNQFEQVIMNLAVNARDAMADGGTVKVNTRNMHADEARELPHAEVPSSDFVLIEVSDTGTGMPVEVLSKVFEPFFTTKDVGQGTGLGLSTVYGIVKQTDGFIYVDSEVGKGTTFKIMLPRHVEEEGEEAAPEVKKPAEHADLTGSACIMLVEDEEAVRAFAARALASRGYTVHEASTGTEALELIEEIDDTIDLVISDVMMPEMDGPTLLKNLRKTQPDLKIIFVSGYAEDAFAKNLDENETFSFLPKPFSLKQLATAVKEVLDGE